MQNNQTDIAKLSEGEFQKEKGNVQATVFRHQYTGPFPPPVILEQLEKLYPGSAKLIIDNAMTQSGHRRKLESIVVQSGSRDSLLGVIFAFIIAMTLTIGSFVCILNDKEAVGLTIGAIGLSSIVGTFIYGTNQNRKEREENARMLQKAKLQ